MKKKIVLKYKLPYFTLRLWNQFSGKWTSLVKFLFHTCFSNFIRKFYFYRIESTSRTIPSRVFDQATASTMQSLSTFGCQDWTTTTTSYVGEGSCQENAVYFVIWWWVVYFHQFLFFVFLLTQKFIYYYQVALRLHQQTGKLLNKDHLVVHLLKIGQPWEVTRQSWSTWITL